MVIQRWQTVFLFIASMLMICFTVAPFAEVEGVTQSLRPADFIGYLTLNIVIAVLLLVAIFLYRNLKLQKKIVAISMVMIIVSAICGGLYLFGPAAPEGKVTLVMGWGIGSLIFSLLLSFMAYRRINADKKLLESADRIW